jgi:hypothetical protein
MFAANLNNFADNFVLVIPKTEFAEFFLPFFFVSMSNLMPLGIIVISHGTSSFKK